MKIIEVNHSIANRYDGYIEINKHLKNYPNLYNPILKHELSHTNKAWSLHDFKLDFFSNSHVDYWSLMKFMFKHPASLLQLSPILYSKKKGFVLDINLLIMFIMFILIFTLTIMFGVRYL